MCLPCIRPTFIEVRFYSNVLQEKRGTTQTTIYLAARSYLAESILWRCRLSSTLKPAPTQVRTIGSIVATAVVGIGMNGKAA